MKIVYLTSRFPWPLDKGDKLRAFHQIRLLSKVNEVHLIAISHDGIPENSKKELLKYCESVNVFQLSKGESYWNTIISFFNGNPLQIGYFFSSRVSELISNHVNLIKPDIVFTQLVRMVEYVKGLNYKKVLDYQDALSLGLKRRFESRKSILNPVLRIEYKRMLKFESSAFNIFNSTMIISQSDLDHLPISNKSLVKIIANGVDTEMFKPDVTIEKKYNLIFAGNMSYPPNIDSAIFLAKEILPRVHLKLPNVNLLLAGANPANEVKSLENKNVKVSGWVDDMVKAYSSADIFIAPMRIGTGLQNKLLEAMSVGLPVITSELANKALNAEPDFQVQIGSCATDYADRILYLLKNKEISQELANNGKDFVKESYSWDKIGLELNNYIKDIVL